MNLVELTKEIVTNLVSDKESVEVKEFESEDENTILIQVMVAGSDIGKVIGKEGKCAKALRTLVQASSYLKDNKKVKINIDSF